MTNISTESGVNTGSAAEHAPVSEGSPVLEAAALAEETIGLVRHWLTEAAKVPVDASAEQLAGVLKDPNGLDFTVGFVDGVVRPEDLQVAARNLAALAPKVPAFLPWYMRSAVRLGGAMAPALPQVVIPVARRVLREMVGHLIVDATDAKLGPAIAKIRKDGIKLNVNLLGEAVLGEHEAARRLEGTHKLLVPPRRRLRLDQGLLHRGPALGLGLRRGRGARRREAHPALHPRRVLCRRRTRRPSSSTWTWRSTRTWT